MLNTLSRNWWLPLVRGLFSIVFGILAIIFPGITLTSFILIFGAYALIDGGFSIYHALFHHANTNGRAWNLFEGVISILAGLAAFFAPFIAGLTLLYVIAFWAIITGAIQLANAWTMREEIENEIFLALAGTFSVLFGLFALFNPVSGALAIATVIGIYAIAFGIMLIMVAFRYRDLLSDDNESNRADAFS